MTMLDALSDRDYLQYMYGPFCDMCGYRQCLCEDPENEIALIPEDGGVTEVFSGEEGDNCPF